MPEQQDYISVGDVAKTIGIDRSTLYYHIKRLNIVTKKFPFNRQAYLAKSDFERLKTLKEEADRLTQGKSPEEAA
jgi:MerR-like DNA binding protein